MAAVATGQPSAEFDAGVAFVAWPGKSGGWKDEGIAGGEVFALAASKRRVDLIQGVVGDRTVMVDIRFSVDGRVEMVFEPAA